MESYICLEVVVCKDFIWNQLQRVVWEDTETLILIHTEDKFFAHYAGFPYLEPVGFPIQDVFKRENGSGRLVPYILSRQLKSAIIENSVSSA